MAMTNIPIMTAVAVAMSASLVIAQNPATGTQRPPTPQEQIAPGERTAPAAAGLSYLDAMTFGCPKAALNAAAREAAKVRSHGTYQFSYFEIINDSHHSSYEIHFKSNYQGEPDLKYCVAMYCQEGWDPTTTKPAVTLMGNTGQSAHMAAHGADCREKPAAVKGGVKR
jgi:hypothetical protein